MFKKDLNWFQMGSEDRKEFKFIFNNNQLEDFKFNYKLTNDKKLFEKRKITSLYLDTINYDLFQISKASDIEKFKLRYRQYNDSSDIYEEIKFSKASGKSKEKKATRYKNLNEISNKMYKNFNLIPCIFISYEREYYHHYDTRITIDKNILFRSSIKRTKSEVKYLFIPNVIEFKLNSKNKEIEKYLPKNPIAFSKFTTGIEKLYKK